MSACRPAPPLGSWPERQRTTGREGYLFMAVELTSKSHGWLPEPAGQRACERKRMVLLHCNRCTMPEVDDESGAIRGNPYSHQPADAAGRQQPLPRRPAAAGMAAALRRGLGRGAPGRVRRVGRRAAAGGRFRRQPPATRAAYPRPLRLPHRPGGVPSELAPADAGRHRPRPARAALARATPRRPGAARRAVLPAQPGRGRQRLPADHDPCRCRRAAPPGGAGGKLAAEDPQSRLRPAAAADGREARPDPGHGADREAGRHRPACQQHARLRRRCAGAGAGL
ncbi:hypothetical protein D9M71_524720 [compost metagenome]